MTKKLTKRPLQEQQNDKRPDKRLKSSKDHLQSRKLSDNGHEKQLETIQNNKTEKLGDKMQKISFDEPYASEETGKSNFDKTKKQRSLKSVKYARKEGEKAPGVLEKRRERKQQMRKQRKNQKLARKEAKTAAKSKDDEDKRSPSNVLDDLLSNGQPLKKEQFKSLNVIFSPSSLAKLGEKESAAICGKVIKLISNSELHNEGLKSFLVNKLGLLLRSGHLSNDNALIVRGLKFLALHAFFAPGEKAKSVCLFSERLREMFRNNLHRSLCAIFKGRHHSTQETDTDQKKNNSKAHLLILNQLIDYLSSLLFDANSHYVCRQTKARSTFEQLVQRQRQLRHEVKNQSDSQTIAMFNAFITFYDLLLLCVFEDTLTTKQTFDELEECLLRARHEFLEEELPTELTQAVGQDHPKWADVLTDVIISYLLKPSQLIRTAVTSVFSLIKEHVSKDAIEQICLALVSDENEEEEVDDEEQLENGEDAESLSEDMDTDSESGEDEEEEKEDSKQENLKEENKNQDEQETDEMESNLASDEESNVSDEEEEEEELEEVDEEFRQKLKLALGKAAVDSDDEDDKKEEDEEEEEEKEEDDEKEDEQKDIELDDEQMLKFDEALANVFRERKNRNKQGKNVAHLEFKSRCLDLVEELITSKSATLSQLLQLAQNLLEMDKKSLNNKTTDLLQRSSYLLSLMVKSKNTANLQVGDNAKELAAQLEKLFNQAIELSSVCQMKLIQDYLYNFCSWCVLATKRFELEYDWTPTLKSLIDKFFKSNNFKLNSMFFVRLLSHNKEFVKQVICEFSQLLSSTNVRQFKQTAAYQVLVHTANCADEEDVQELSEELLEQHMNAALSLVTQLKKSNSLLFNNIVLFLLTLVDRFGPTFGSKKAKLISTLKNLVKDAKCKRTFSKEVKAKVRKLKSELEV